jgi:tRNA dimethylallyltransferase
VGKSEAAALLAGRFNGEIINCDSMQVYRGFDIGTDKPVAELRAKIPHHLLDIADPNSQFSAGDFVREALTAVRLIDGRGRLPFVVGGTGLYLKALLEGLFPGPGRDVAVRRRLEEEARERGLESLRQRLEELDPAYSRVVGARDRVRIIRALEVYILTGKPISEHFAATKPEATDFQPLKIGLQLERKELYRKIEERVERMFQNGIVRETMSLLASGVSEAAAPFRALGYKHVLSFLKKQISLEEAIERTKTDTRHYAKRQITWFRKMKGIQWFPAGDLMGVATFLETRLAS